jgi:hypothetical protein
MKKNNKTDKKFIRTINSIQITAINYYIIIIYKIQNISLSINRLNNISIKNHKIRLLHQCYLYLITYYSLIIRIRFNIILILYSFIYIKKTHTNYKPNHCAFPYIQKRLAPYLNAVFLRTSFLSMSIIFTRKRTANKLITFFSVDYS